MLHSNRYVLAALVGLAAVSSSCTREQIHYESENSQKSKVQLDVRAFGIEQSALTKAGEGQDPHRIVFKAFDSSGAVAYETVQTSSQDGFGALDFELSPGLYTFVAVAHDLSKSDLNLNAGISSPGEAALPEALVQDTFCDTLNVSIKPGVPFAAGMTLPRIISCFKIKFNDVTPAGTKMVKIVANTDGAASDANASFNPSTGLALSNRQYFKEVDISPAIGRINNAVSINLFLTDEEQDINVKVTAYDAEGQEIISHTLENVPMKLNRTTTACDNFFTAGGSGSFSFSTSWDTEAEINY